MLLKGRVLTKEEGTQKYRMVNGKKEPQDWIGIGSIDMDS